VQLYNDDVYRKCNEKKQYKNILCECKTIKWIYVQLFIHIVAALSSLAILTGHHL